MNKKILTAALIGSAIVVIAGNKKEPVLMTIDGNKVTLGEFEYLYNKNNTQQVEPLTLDQYVDMFVNYKLKVADAIDEGIDTTEAFKQEFIKFRDELAAPYLRDEEAAEKLVQEAYSHMAEDVFVSHIMLKPNTNPSEHNDATLDSLRNLILNGTMTFEEVAEKYSVDKPSAVKGGKMGWVTGNSRLPWDFEEMSYNTKVGEISPVINSGFGFHIIRPEQRRKPIGEVKAQHILVLTRGMDSLQVEAKKQLIDSIYQVATAPGANFSDLASRLSEDPGSARKGGDLGWFGSGRMVPEFEETAFALADGEISKPFATSYGYHIILKNAHRGDTVPTLDKVRKKIEDAIAGDARSRIPVKSWIEKTAAKTNSSVNSNLAAQVEQFVAANITPAADAKAVTDSLTIEKLKNCPIAAYTVNGKTATVGDVLATRNIRAGVDAAATAMMVDNAAKAAFDAAMLDYGREELEKTNADYRNLTNEYRDGILLFEVANKKVWNKASKDKEGLQQFFLANRDKYTWDSPRFKSYVIFAANDSVLTEAKNYTATLNTNISQEELSTALRKKFGRDVKLEKVIAAKGENPITDFLGFGGPKPENLNQRWAGYFAFAQKIIGMPEEATDMKGAVVTDYQNYLEKQWLDQLKSKHKVKIDQKVLKKAK